LGERQNSPYVLKGLAEIAAAEGKYNRAALLLGAMDALCRELDFYLWADDARTYIEQLESVRTRISPPPLNESGMTAYNSLSNKSSPA
jgi:hypothetical protein